MLGEMIKELRCSHKLSQVALANRLGVTKQSVSNWENDNILPSIDMLIKLADSFSVSTDYLLGRSTERILDVTNLDAESIAILSQLVKKMSANQKYEK